MFKCLHLQTLRDIEAFHILKSEPSGLEKLLGITTLYNDMILSTLSISSRGFALNLTNRDVFLTYKPRIIPSQQFFPRTKYTIEPLLKFMEPSNSLPLIEARLPSLEPSNKVHLYSTLESLLTTPSRLSTFLFDI